MAQILGFDGATLLKVDSGSGAARITPYNTAGVVSNLEMDGGYFLPFEIRQTSAAAAAVTVWAMRNGATKRLFVRRIKGSMYFDGTASAANGLRYAFCRFSTATPTAGTSILGNIIKRSNADDAATTVTDARFLDTGLTTTSVVFETPFAIVAIPASVTSMIREFDFAFKTPNDPRGELRVGVNEGICIRILSVAAIVGMGILGDVEWDEKT